MGARLKRMGDTRLPSNFKIQITSMVDMFVIILVFMIKSYSTSPIQVTPSKDLRLPSSSSLTPPKDVLKIKISKSAVSVEDRTVVELKNGQVPLDKISKDHASFIEPLFNDLEKEAKKTEELAKVNETVKFSGEVLIQADKDMPYEVLEKVMYTALAAGYSDVKFAVVQ